MSGFGQQSVFFETQAYLPRVEIWRVMIMKLVLEGLRRRNLEGNDNKTFVIRAESSL